MNCVYMYKIYIQLLDLAQLAGAVKYTDCISAQE